MPITRRVTPPHVPASLCHRAGQRLQDLHVYDPAAMAWTELSAASSGTPPSARAFHGFASTVGKLYIHGGSNNGSEYDGGEVKGYFAANSLVVRAL